MKKSSNLIITLIAGLLLSLALATGVFAAENTKPSIAFDSLNNRYLAVYVKYGGAAYDVYGEMVSADGAPAGSEFPITTGGSVDGKNAPAIAYDSANRNFLVTWVDTRNNGVANVYGQLIKFDGVLNAGNFVISDAAGSQTAPATAWDKISQRFLVVWQDSRNQATSAGDIYGQLVNPDGSLFGAASASNFSVTKANGDQKSPAIAFDSANERFLVVWSDSRNGNWDIYGQILNADGSIYNGSPDFVVSNDLNSQNGPSAAFDSGNNRYLVVWHDNRKFSASEVDIYGQFISMTGQLVNRANSTASDNFVISDNASQQFSPSVAYDAGGKRFLAVWQDYRDISGHSEIYGQHLNAADGALDTPSNSNSQVAAVFGGDLIYSKIAYNQNCGNYLAAFEKVTALATEVGFALVGAPCPVALTVTPPNYDFTSIAAGASSPKETFTLSNSSSSSRNISTVTLGGVNPSDFSIQYDGCSGKMLSPSASCTVDAQFSPMSGGAKSAALSISSNDPVTPVVNAVLSGTGLLNQLTVTRGGTGSGAVTSFPAGIDCGGVCSASYPPGTSVTLNAIPDPGSTFTGWSGGWCSGTSTCVVTLDAGKTVTATFQPDTTPPILSENFETGMLPANWSLIDNAGTGVVWRFDNPGNRTNLTGGSGKFATADSDYAGIANVDTELRLPLDLSLQPTVYLLFKTDFHVYSGNEIADVDVSVDGPAGPWAHVWRKAVNDYRGPHTEVVPLTAIAAGKRNVIVSFHYYKANYDWWWEIDDVSVVSALPVISVTPLLANFSAVGVGNSAVPQTFTVTNKGGLDLSMGQIYFSGAPVDYVLQNDNCSAKTLPPGGSCTVNALFTPASIGARNAGMEIPSNDPAHPVLEAALLGTGAYTITASTGAGGSVSTSGAVAVMPGSNQVFTITPATGYRVLNVLVDGVSVGAVTSYTFSNVKANHTISATFAANTCTITTSAGTNGSIGASVTLNYGGNQVFTITPATGYHILDVLVDGVSVGAVASYSFNNVTANHAISASFASNPVISASVDPGGSISPSGAVAVSLATSQLFTITPAFGYQVADIFVDGVSKGAANTYTFASVTASHTIKATFTASQLSVLTVSSGETSTPITYQPSTNQSATTNSATAAAQLSSVVFGQPASIAPAKESSVQEPPREEPRSEPPVFEPVIPVPDAVARLSTEEKAKEAPRKPARQSGEVKYYVKSGVIKRFTEYSGEKTPKGFLSLFSGGESQGVMQEPAACLADGVSTVRVTIDLGAAGGSEPNIMLKGVRTISIGRVGDNSLVVELLPDAGVHEASISIVRDGSMTEYPLTVAPMVDVDLDRSGRVTEADFNLFLKERTTGKSPRFGLDDNEVRNLTDIYIFTVNYIVQSSPKSTRDAK